MDTVVLYRDNNTKVWNNGFLLTCVEDWFWLFYKVIFVYWVEASVFSMHCFFPNFLGGNEVTGKVF